MELKLGHLFLMAFVSFAIGTAFEAVLLPVLRKLKAGQSIREEGPEAHQAKSGTPTMGGIAIVLAAVICSIVFGIIYKLDMASIAAVLAATFIYAAIGFIDDYIKVVKKRNLGLTAKQKLALQIATAAALAIFSYTREGGSVFIPCFKINLNFGWFYVPFVAFVMVAMTNAVNLTDGLDGLASSVTAVVGLFFAMFCVTLKEFSASAVFACVCGACLGFLVFNHYPAKVFMGDTGSLALGGALAAAAVVSRTELLLPIAGGVYVAEALSVIIQVVVFKTQNGRRFFRMAPLHHHFELGGWSEVKVVSVFVAVTAILCLVAGIGIIG